METSQTICLLNDSFPPQIDGVANAVANYAKNIHAQGGNAMVITPSHPKADDEGYPYPILRYPSITFPKMDGYMAGIPFSPEVARRVTEEPPALLHSHCPIMSTFMARKLRQITGAPIVLTYHTKFDIDIANITRAKPVQIACKKALVENIQACDEVWVVSQGAGENLRQLGYEGEYVVMPNGVDLPLGRASGELVRTVTGEYDLPENVPVYLFVGRMMWYKGIRIILDALAGLSQDYRMVFVGEGNDRAEMEAYAAQLGIQDKCVFAGTVLDREALRAWYTRADLFLFPSSFDTNGLVVREAAACGTPSVLLTGSCAAEGAVHGQNGFLIEENAESMRACLQAVSGNRELLEHTGRAAGQELYVSWADAVKAATERYQTVIDRCRREGVKHKLRPMENVMRIDGELMEALAKLSAAWRSRE